MVKLRSRYDKNQEFWDCLLRSGQTRDLGLCMAGDTPSSRSTEKEMDTELGDRSPSEEGLPSRKQDYRDSGYTE